jgi:hypothetical protein
MLDAPLRGATGGERGKVTLFFLDKPESVGDELTRFLARW